MERRILMVLAALAMPFAVNAADSTDRSAPYDSNPACMDRTADASTGNCVIKDEGTPRHIYPPRPSTASAAPASAPASTAAPTTTVRRAPATSR